MVYGWRIFWEYSTAAYINKELSTRPLSEDIRPKIKSAFKHNSFDVFTDIVIPVALMVGYDIVKELWKWHKSLVRRQIETKKKFMTREAAVEAVEELARRSDIATTNSIETIKFIDVIDEALNYLVEPINRSAKRIDITSKFTESTLHLSQTDKAALKSGYYIDPALRSKSLETLCKIYPHQYRDGQCSHHI